MKMIQIIIATHTLCMLWSYEHIGSAKRSVEYSQLLSPEGGQYFDFDMTFLLVKGAKFLPTLQWHNRVCILCVRCGRQVWWWCYRVRQMWSRAGWNWWKPSNDSLLVHQRRTDTWHQHTATAGREEIQGGCGFALPFLLPGYKFKVRNLQVSVMQICLVCSSSSLEI